MYEVWPLTYFLQSMINNGHEEGRKVAYDEDDDDFEAMLG